MRLTTPNTKTRTLRGLLLLLLLALPGALTGAARAATLTVTDPGDSGGSGQLRQVLGRANTGDMVVFAAGVTAITLNGNELQITRPLTVSGPGVTINANGKSRVLEVIGGTASQPVALGGLTIEDGSAPGNAGGGVVVDGGATAVLADCTLTGDSADGGYGGGLANGGTVTLTNCTLTGNSSSGGGYSGGGGGLFNGRTATLTGCTLANNSASHGFGGGLLNQGTATLTACALTGDSAQFGGGLVNQGTATLTACALTGNSATEQGGLGSGGGLYNGGPATLTNCDLTGDSASADGGGVYNDGGSHVGYGTLALTGCTLTGDSAQSGGGVYNAGTVTLTACALVGNSGSGSIGGGGLLNYRTATVTGCTLTGNSAPNFGASGGGLLNFYGGTATLTDDILYGDTHGFGGSGGEISDAGYGSSITVTYCDIQGGYGDAGDVNISADPQFVGTGATPYAVRTGSPVVGAGVAAPGNGRDITGAPRHAPPTIGAYENALVTTGTSLVSSLNPSDYGQDVTFTVTVADTSPGGATPTGTVSLSGLPGGAQSLTLSGGTAVYRTSALPTGTYALTASYTPDSPGLAPSTSLTLTQTVLVNTGTSLVSSLNPSDYGQRVTFTATVDTQGGPAPAGSVAFYVDGAAAPAATVPVSGTAASYATSALASGAHTVTATFTGAGFAASSAGLQQTVLVNDTTGLTSSLNPSAVGQRVTFTATVDTEGGPAPAGSVSFLDFSAPSGGPGGFLPYTLLATVPLSGTTATYATSALAPGGHPLVAEYNPGPAFAASSATLTQTVLAPTSISGTVTLTGWLGTGEKTPALTFTLTPTGGGAATTQTLTPTATANPSQFTYTLTGVFPGAYTLGVKGPLWLREDVPGGVTTAGGNVSGASVTLPPGDINGDNVIDGNDTALLRVYFNTVSGRTGFSASADLNGDGVVDGNDTALLRAHFNAVGRPY